MYPNFVSDFFHKCSYLFESIVTYVNLEQFNLLRNINLQLLLGAADRCGQDLASFRCVFVYRMSRYGVPKSFSGGRKAGKSGALSYKLAEELGLIVEASLTKPKLDLIVKSPDYIEDDVKMIDSIVKDRIRTEEKEEKLRENGENMKRNCDEKSENMN
ncbi:hypothetical protein TNCV_1143301 [Trichonephila clavipes]|nr:hypothetical protein TNCV_1143301 [Trichonephila clavipes]